MARIRLLFVALSVLLLLPVILLVKKALDNVAVERETRHQAVVDRLVDEMERELTGWLRQEEDRPFSHYRFLHLPEDVPGASQPVRSPLADGPTEPFVLMHFQIEPGGALTCPLWPEDLGTAEEILGWRMDPNMQQQRDEILGLLADLLKRPLTGADLNQEAGTTVELPDGAAGPAKPPGPVDRGDRALAQLRSRPADLLSQLNRAGESRKERTTKVTQSQALNVMNFYNKLPSQPERPAAGQDLFFDPLEVVDVSLEPMVSRPLNDGGVMLYRTVVIADRAYRQGMVIDSPALVSYLAGRVLDTETKARTRQVSAGGATVHWGGADTKPAETKPADGNFTYRHHFAEPFNSVVAVVGLEPLPELPATLYLYFLTILLGCVATFGLMALYRMVDVQVRFAERRSNFVSAVTHELKTPLTAIRMHGEMLRDGVVPSAEKRQSYYRIITAESERLTRLLNNVLELSRLEQQDRKLDLRMGDARSVLEEVVEVLGPHAAQKGFQLELRMAEELPVVTFDRDALLQVLFNLVDNAIKYSSKSQDKRVILSCWRAEGCLRLSVADRGPGVPRQHLQSIFEPFYRGENELTRSAKGTGIGLALVRGLVETMGGMVRGRNRDGGGFEVTIDLFPFPS